MFRIGHLGGLAKDEARRRDASQGFQLDRRFRRRAINTLAKSENLHAAYADTRANRTIGVAARVHPLGKNGHSPDVR